jgi:hypothetical protein
VHRVRPAIRPIADKSPVAMEHRQQDTIAVPTFVVAFELRRSYLTQYPNQGAGEQVVQSDAVRASGT